MKLSLIILERLKNDLSFRLGTATALGVSERNVYYLAKNSSDNLTKAAAILFFKKEGLSEKEIFDVPPELEIFESKHKIK